MKISSQIFSFSILKSFTVVVFIMFLVLCPAPRVLGQFIDNFSDNDFTESPTWTGDVSDFTATSGVLNLNAPAVASTSMLVTTSQALVNTSWEFKVIMGFNPSATNYARIYLASDQADLSGALSGYYVMIGNTADEVSLYRQTGTTKTKIIDGEDGILNFSPISLSIRVTRDAEGMWKLFTDVGSTGTYVEEGTVNDATHIASSYFGIHCIYTATRSTLFSFDDFAVHNTPLGDHEPPYITQVEVLSGKEIVLRFSENLETFNAETITHYLVSPQLGTPVSAILQADSKTVILSFNESMVNGIEYDITTQGLTDEAGNVMPLSTNTFLNFIPTPAQIKDVIITEVFPDPSPQQALPEFEFIEIYNRSSHPFNLLNWTISDGTSTATLTDYTLLPNTYLIITTTVGASAFNGYGHVMGVAKFPSLNNTNDVLVLRNETHYVIDSVYYTDALYGDLDKKQGGWTLELIDPNNTCAEQENWIASENIKGGTPGAINSVHAEKPDLTGPELLVVYPVALDTLRLVFNEKLENGSPSKTSFVLTGSHNVVDVILNKPSLREIDLVVSPLFQHGILYQVEVQDLYDCAGNKLLKSGLSFALPQSANSHDVVINEILFNPTSTGIDFVEILNTSDKYIDLKNWRIANIDNGSIENEKIIVSRSLLFAPGDILVFTPSPELLKSEYIQGIESNFMATNLPAFNNTSGSVALIKDDGELIDSFFYSDKMHSVFLKDTKGVSLERILPRRPSDDVKNWKSSNAANGFATPGYRNSNFREEIIADHAIKVDPEVFLPIYGQPDFAQIHYQFDQGGFMANVKIYDAQGQLIKKIADNTSLGTQGSLRWDGDRDDGSKARIGAYMIWFEVFDNQGVVKTFKRRVAIAGRF